MLPPELVCRRGPWDVGTCLALCAAGVLVPGAAVVSSCGWGRLVSSHWVHAPHLTQPPAGGKDPRGRDPGGAGAPSVVRGVGGWGDSTDLPKGSCDICVQDNGRVHHGEDTILPVAGNTSQKRGPSSSEGPGLPQTWASQRGTPCAKPLTACELQPGFKVILGHTCMLGAPAPLCHSGWTRGCSRGHPV